MKYHSKCNFPDLIKLVEPKKKDIIPWVSRI